MKRLSEGRRWRRAAEGEDDGTLSIAPAQASDVAAIRRGDAGKYLVPRRYRISMPAIDGVAEYHAAISRHRYSGHARHSPALHLAVSTAYSRRRRSKAAFAAAVVPTLLNDSAVAGALMYASAEMMV